MKTFLVEVVIQAGECQKKTTKLVQATSQTEAESYALTSECHGDLGEGTEWTESGIADLDWEFHYQVGGCKEVEPAHVAVLRQYLTLVQAPGCEADDSVRVNITRTVSGTATERLEYKIPAALWQETVAVEGSSSLAIEVLRDEDGVELVDYQADVEDSLMVSDEVILVS